MTRLVLSFGVTSSFGLVGWLVGWLMEGREIEQQTQQ